MQTICWENVENGHKLHLKSSNDNYNVNEPLLSRSSGLSTTRILMLGLSDFYWFSFGFLRNGKEAVVKMLRNRTKSGSYLQALYKEIRCYWMIWDCEFIVKYFKKSKDSF